MTMDRRYPAKIKTEKIKKTKAIGTHKFSNSVQLHDPS